MSCQPILGFLPGSPGALELLVIFALVLLLFGPRKLPEIARMIGKALRELRHASEDFKDQIMRIEEETIAESPVVDSADDRGGDSHSGSVQAGLSQEDPTGLDEVTESEEARNG